VTERRFRGASHGFLLNESRRCAQSSTGTRTPRTICFRWLIAISVLAREDADSLTRALALLPGRHENTGRQGEFRWLSPWPERRRRSCGARNVMSSGEPLQGLSAQIHLSNLSFELYGVATVADHGLLPKRPSQDSPISGQYLSGSRGALHSGANLGHQIIHAGQIQGFQNAFSTTIVKL
jgi:hypothetical protein